MQLLEVSSTGSVELIDKETWWLRLSVVSSRERSL